MFSTNQNERRHATPIRAGPKVNGGSTRNEYSTVRKNKFVLDKVSGLNTEVNKKESRDIGEITSKSRR